MNNDGKTLIDYRKENYLISSYFFAITSRWCMSHACSTCGATDLRKLLFERAIGNEISDDEKKEINMISFTGSTIVGKKIIKDSANNVKRLSLELGGKNSFIVLSDANINKTVNIIINSFTGNAGQFRTCARC